MARRPIFRPIEDHPPFVEEVVLEFEWHPGFAKAQAQKSIASLHEAARTKGLSPVLEISSKSRDALGVALSAFNLSVEFGGRRMSVECLFQGSKVFEKGGPYRDLYETDSRSAKTDERLCTSGRLVRFDLLGEEWPTTPLTAFYDWVYAAALTQHPDLAARVVGYAAFSDIAFNPEKSINCQARSAAVYSALSRNGRLAEALSCRERFLEATGGLTRGPKPRQTDLFAGLE